MGLTQLRPVPARSGGPGDGGRGVQVAVGGQLHGGRARGHCRRRGRTFGAQVRWGGPAGGSRGAAAAVRGTGVPLAWRRSISPEPMLGPVYAYLTKTIEPEASGIGSESPPA